MQGIPATASPSSDRPAFAFGRNWARFARYHLDDRVLDLARHSLSDFLSPWRLEGRSFLDVGCGSGLFSLAAFCLGASPITSFDVDPDSVACCEELRRRAGSPQRWRVVQGSVLDPRFMESIEPANVVYSWGVLHHTGRMWDAVASTAGRIAPDGLLYLALYNRAQGWRFHPDGTFGPSSFWAREKRFYNALPTALQRGVEVLVAGTWIAASVLSGRDPFREIREYRAKSRGMSWIVDVRDWLGGYPYECASPDEVTSFCRDRLGLRLERLLHRPGTHNNEFLFRRPGA